MKKTWVYFLLVLDIVILGLSGYILIERIVQHLDSNFTKNQPQNVPSTKLNETEKINAEGNSIDSKLTDSDQTSLPSQPKELRAPIFKSEKKRKILFQYRDSIPKRVSIVGKFNQWSPQLMKKNDQHQWSITLQISPGKYAYNFIVDGKMIRDPSNKKSIQAGQKIASSLLSIQ